MPKTDQVGVDLIKSFEGLVLHSYQDAVGVWTNGYGNTHNVPQDTNSTITQDQAEATLEENLRTFEEGVNNLVSRNLSPNQFAALVSFAYNLGLGSLASSTLLTLVNKGDFQGAAGQFKHWVYAGGEVLEGLVRRRAAEAELFLK